jgi:hypothetical protein
VLNAQAGDSDIFILHHHAGMIELMHGEQPARVRAALIGNADINVELLVGEKISRQSQQPDRAVSIEMDRQAGDPCVVE